MFQNPGNEEIKKILSGKKTIAVVGISDKKERDSYRVSLYMKENGYRIIPVNPKINEVLGEKAYPDLSSIPEPVDIVNVFRRSEEVPGVVAEAVSLNPAAIWLQLGVINEEAALLAQKKGIKVIMDRCIKIEHCLLVD